MTTRVLPVEEWARLEGTLLDPLWRQCDPSVTEILVVEQDGAIVAMVALLSVLHLECLSSPGAAAGRALWRLVRTRVRAAGGRAVWASCVEAPMRRILQRHGEPIPGEHFLMRMTRCLQ